MMSATSVTSTMAALLTRAIAPFRSIDPVLIALMALGLALRLLFLSHDSLWLDEINSLIVAAARGYPSHPPEGAQTAQWFFERHLAWRPLDLAALTAMLKQNVHAPLYYLLLNPWLGAWGLSEASLRGFSVLFSVLMIVPVYGLAFAVAPPGAARRTARWAALLAAVSPFQLAFAQEGRMYALALFESALAALALWQTLYGARFQRWAVVLALSAIAGCFTHYSFWFQTPFYALFAFSALAASGDDPLRAARRRALMGAGLALTLAMAAWSPILLAQRTGVSSGGDHFSLGLLPPLRMLGMLGWEPLTTLGGETIGGRIFYGVLLLAALAVIALTMRRRKPALAREGFLFMGILLPLAAQGVVDWFGDTHTLTIVRYAMLIAPLTIVLAAFGLGALPLRRAVSRSAATVLTLALLATGVLAVWPGAPLRYKAKFPARAMMAQLAGKAAPSDLLAINGPLATPCEAAYYLMRYRPQTPILYWARGGLFPAGTAAPSTPQLASWSRVWLFFYRSRQAHGSHALRQALRDAFLIEEPRLGYGGKLMRYRSPRLASSSYKSQ
ncbi:MAG: glycosyltransferase family 39 protein [Vampirovibrionales bacterium]|nr:glycosyltransferase family 39 protein [Vampirovibrionales bacterium]